MLPFFFLCKTIQVAEDSLIAAVVFKTKTENNQLPKVKQRWKLQFVL